MRNFLRAYPAEAKLLLVLILLFIGLSLASDSFSTASNLTSLLNNNAVNVIWAVGLLTLAMLVPIISGGFNLAIIYTANIAGLTLAYVLNTHGGVDPFGGFGRVLPVVVALFVLQVLSSGLNLLGANQHLSTAVWGLFLIGVMILRWTAANLRQRNKGKG